MSLSPKQALRSLSDSALGDRLKTALRFRAPKLIRPFSKNATVSDLFPWRVDETWDTRFDVMNIPSIIFPEQAVEDIASIHIFDHDGNRLSTHQIKVPPFSSVPVMIRSLLKNSSGTGTFACFHAAIGQHELTEAGSIIAERNYVSFRQQEDTLWSYVHGNANALVKPNDNDSLKTLAGKPENSYSYRPQVRFDDCLRFELIYINPLGSGLISAHP
jgi:hypothetical protein